MSDIDLSSPEVKEAIKAAVEAATGPLVAKRDELLGEVKKLRRESQIDPAELEKVEAERDELKQKLAETERNATKAAKELEAATKRLADTEGAYANTMRDAALTAELTKAGVTSPALLKAAKALLAEGVAVVDEDGRKAVKAGDKSLTDFISEWASGHEGKHFIAAPEISGGGAQSARGGKTTDKAPDVDDRASRAALYAERLKNSTGE